MFKCGEDIVGNKPVFVGKQSNIKQTQSGKDTKGKQALTAAMA